jgi:lysophospholipase L1-like esterase
VPGWNSFMAIGDSFTEGLNDPGAEGQFRGWADRLAERLGADNPDFRYANLAVRGKYLRQVMTDQLPQAETARPDLVAFCAGGNDILRPHGDPDSVAAEYESGVARLRAVGSEVLIFTGFDTRQTPVLRHVRGRIATYNAHLWAIADRHDCRVVDLWSMAVLLDRQAWSDDRLHLSPEGHRRVALRTAAVLGLPGAEEWSQPWPPSDRPDWLELRMADWRWTREHFLPWIVRHARGRSSGDGLPAKRPELAPLERSCR